MTREEAIRALLVSILETIVDVTGTMESEDTDRGTIHLPELRYVPAFEFFDEDINLIRSLGEETMKDFSILTKKPKEEIKEE